MTGLIQRQFRSNITQDIPHFGLRFPYRQATNRNSWERHVADEASALLAKFWFKSALDDTEKRLFCRGAQRVWSGEWPTECRSVFQFPRALLSKQGTFRPPMGTLHRLLCSFMGTGVGS